MTSYRRSGLALASALASALACAILPIACDSPTTPNNGPSSVSVDSAVVSAQGVSPAPGRTYEYASAQVRPDSVLLDLWNQGVDVQVAWLPLDYRCEDPIGARLTVQLAAPDARMADHDFTVGTGRLACAQQLTKYLLVPVGGM